MTCFFIACVNIFLFFSVPDLYFVVSLSFFQKDLPLPRKNSRWVLLLFTLPLPSLSLLPASVFFLCCLGGDWVPTGTKNSYTEWGCHASGLSSVRYQVLGVHQPGSFSWMNLICTLCVNAVRVLQRYTPGVCSPCVKEEEFGWSDCSWKLWGFSSGACGLECVVLVWRRRRRLPGGMLGVCQSQIRSSAGCCPWCWNTLCLFPSLIFSLFIRPSPLPGF